MSGLYSKSSLPIVGRQEEKALLQRFLESKKSEFMAVYGRRRVGKTFLITQFFSKKPCIFFHVTGIKDGMLSDQLNHFSRSLAQVFYQGLDLERKKNWFDAFYQLTEAIKALGHRKKTVIFFDELPWMATPKSKLIQAIDHYWNHYWSVMPSIRLIVCGSSASWILNHLVHNKGGLYNRITRHIELRPFSLSETRDFLNKKKIGLGMAHIVKIYMAMGGIPLYLDQIEKGLSADQNIDRICFSKNGLLFSEFKKLFDSLFVSGEVHEELVRLIAVHRYGISQVDLMKQSSKSVGGRLKKKLEELEDSGFIQSFVPYPNKERGLFYRLIDEYVLFYLKWIEPAARSIRRVDKEMGYWLSKQKTPAFQSWSGYAFEAICYKHLPQIRRKLRIPPDSEVGVWRYVPRNGAEDGAQIDLLFDRSDDTVTLCEIKYTQKPWILDKGESAKLIRKLEVFKKHSGVRKECFFAFIAASGIRPSVYTEDWVSAVVVLEDLFV